MQTVMATVFTHGVLCSVVQRKRRKPPANQRRRGPWRERESERERERERERWEN